MFREFEGRLLRRLLGFTWKDKISSTRLKKLTGLRDINVEKMFAVDCSSTQDEKGQTTKTDTKMDKVCDVEVDLEAHGEELVRELKMQTAQTLRKNG
jgi:hypothetical protein